MGSLRYCITLRCAVGSTVTGETIKTLLYHFGHVRRPDGGRERQPQAAKKPITDQRGHLNRNLRFRAQSWGQNRRFLAEIPRVVLIKIGAIRQDMLKRQQGDMC